MPLTIADRKHLMPHGAQREIAADLGVDESYVSRVVAEAIHPRTARGRKQLRRIQVAVARKLGITVDEAFPPAEPVQQVA
jgi:hypothetical protein